MDNRLSRYIIKQSDCRDNNLKYDFMPSLLEIIERPSHIAGKMIITFIALLLIFAILWASLSKIDIVVTGVGYILPEGKISELQSYNGGKIEKIHYKVGDYVNAGDEIITIDSSTINAEIEKLMNDLEWCEIRYDIYSKLLKSDEAIINSNDYNPKFINGVNSIIDEAKLYLMQKEQQEKSKVNAVKELDKAKAEGNSFLISMQQEQVEQSEINIQTNLLQHRSQMYRTLNDLKREMYEYEVQLKKHKLNLEGSVVNSTVSGYINSLLVNYEGEVVNAAQSVATIVPSDAPLSFECYIQDRDIAKISIGDEVVIKLSAFSYSTYGSISGKIDYISSSTFANETLGNVYIVKIFIDKDKISKEIELISGLSASAEIIVGKRSVLNYFLEPITKGLDNSLKES